jgi:hypothetical protein
MTEIQNLISIVILLGTSIYLLVNWRALPLRWSVSLLAWSGALAGLFQFHILLGLAGTGIIYWYLRPAVRR